MGSLFPLKHLQASRHTPFARLLIPVDASDRSRWAINYAIRCARSGKPVEAYLLYIIEPVAHSEVLRFHTEQEVRQRFEERAGVFLDAAADALSRAGVRSYRFCREDAVVSGILAFAEEKGCAEIVVPRTSFLGLFSYGLAAKLLNVGTRVPVVQVMADGSL